MKIKIISFGKFKSSQAYEQIFNYYKKRVSIDTELVELKGSKGPSKLLKEKKEIIKYLNKDEYTFVLDSCGETMTSEKFSELIFKQYIDGFKTINFLIGSEVGLVSEIKKSFVCLSFGNFTWPHLLVRVMLIEQIYRALEIRKNTNYHKKSNINE